MTELIGKTHSESRLITEDMLASSLKSGGVVCIPAASKVCCNFPETLKYLPEDKAVLTGSPIREELLHGAATPRMINAALIPTIPL